MIAQTGYLKRSLAQDDQLPGPASPIKLQLIVTGPHCHIQHGLCWEVCSDENIAIPLLIPQSCPTGVRIVVENAGADGEIIDSPMSKVG